MKKCEKKLDLQGLIQLLKNQKDTPEDIYKIINDNFWELIDGETEFKKKRK